MSLASATQRNTLLFSHLHRQILKRTFSFPSCNSEIQNELTLFHLMDTSANGLYFASNLQYIRLSIYLSLYLSIYLSHYQQIFPVLAPRPSPFIYFCLLADSWSFPLRQSGSLCPAGGRAGRREGSSLTILTLPQHTPITHPTTTYPATTYPATTLSKLIPSY